MTEASTVPWLTIIGLIPLVGSLLVAFVPGSAGLTAILWLVLMMGLIFALARILRMICGPHPLFVAAMTLVMMVPPMLLTDFLQHFLGIYPPGS